MTDRDRMTVETLVKRWSSERYQNVMLPALGMSTCGEVALLIEDVSRKSRPKALHEAILAADTAAINDEDETRAGVWVPYELWLAILDADNAACPSPPQERAEPSGDGKHPSHKTRIGDASSWDEICVKCGAADSMGDWGKLAEPCPKEHSEWEPWNIPPKNPPTPVEPTDIDGLVERLRKLDFPQSHWPVSHEGLPLAREAADLIATLTKERDEARRACEHSEGMLLGYAEDLKKATEERDALREALKRLVLDVQDYEAWQRPCDALDKARAVLSQSEG